MAGKRRYLGLLLMGLLLASTTGCAWQSRDQAAEKTVKSVVVQTEELKQLDQAAQDMYNQVKQDNVLGAKHEMETIKQLLTGGVDFTGATDSYGVSALIEAVMAADKDLNRVRYSHEDSVNAAAAVRLATDALIHHGRPMWLEVEQVINDDIGELEARINARELPGIEQAAESLRTHYELIRPAAVISRGYVPTGRIDSIFAFLSAAMKNSPPDLQQMQSAADHFRQAFGILFKDKGQTTELPVPFTPVSPIGPASLLAVIAVVLAYVGWRKARSSGDYTVIRKRSGTRES